MSVVNLLSCLLEVHSRLRPGCMGGVRQWCSASSVLVINIACLN